MFDHLPASASDFYQLVLGTTLRAIKETHLTDNFDHERFGPDGVDRSRDFRPQDRVFYFDWFFRTHSALFDAYQRLADDHSRMLLLHLIAYRLGGHQSVRIPLSFGRDRPNDRSAYFDAETSQPSQLSIAGMFGALKHFDFFFEGIRYKADCIGLEYCLYRKQYFFSRDGIRIAPQLGDHVIDGGACLGDSAVVFANAAGSEGKVYAFDPVQEHIDVIDHNARQNSGLQIQSMPFGLSDVDVFEEPISLKTYAPGFRCDGQSVPLASIDSLVASGAIAQVNFIKFDIEGSELNALRGATSTIRKFRPKLAISVYHKPDDLFEIPIYLSNTFPFYRMYLDHYSIHSEETVCYCIDGSRGQ